MKTIILAILLAVSGGAQFVENHDKSLPLSVDRHKSLLVSMADPQQFDEQSPHIPINVHGLDSEESLAWLVLPNIRPGICVTIKIDASQHKPIRAHPLKFNDNIKEHIKNFEETKEGDVVKGSFNIVEEKIIRTVKYTWDPEEGITTEVSAAWAPPQPLFTEIKLDPSQKFIT